MSETTSEVVREPKKAPVHAPPAQDDHGHEDHSHEYPYVQHHFDSPQQQFEAGKLGIWLFLVTEVLFFSGLFCAYTIYRSQHPEVFNYAHYYLDTNMGALNTIVLILSSLTAAWAVRCAQRGETRRLVVNILVTIACACTFMVVKYLEYSHKFHDGLLPGPNFQPKHAVWELDVFKDKHPEAAAAAERLLKLQEEPAATAAAAPQPSAPKAASATEAEGAEAPAPGTEEAKAEGSGAEVPSETAAADTQAGAAKAALPATADKAQAAGKKQAAASKQAAEAAEQASGKVAAQESGAEGEVAAAKTAPETAEGAKAVATADDGAAKTDSAPKTADGAGKTDTAKTNADDSGLANNAADAQEAPASAPPEAAPSQVAAATPAPVDPQIRLREAIRNLTPVEAKPLVDAGIIRNPSEGPVTIERPDRVGTFFGIYFTMTGLHGIHVLVGIGIWIWLLTRALKGQFGPLYFGPIDFAALYWHLVDLIWIYLFPLLYLIH